MVNLLSSLEVDGMTLENRIVLPPMQSGEASSDGEVTKELKDHYSERADGSGLIIIEHCYISRQGKFASNQLGIYENDLVSGLSELVDVIHEKDTPVIAQINHAGKQVDERNVDLTPVGPSEDENCRKLNQREIEKIVTDFGRAAERAIKARFDGVEVHGAHGFLLNQFYSPLTNKREDEYGGSFEKRVKLPLKVVDKVKEKINGEALLYRLGSVDLDPKGNKIEDSKKFAGMLADKGIDIIDVSGGICGSSPEEISDKQGYFMPQASKIKKNLNIPVIGVGGIKSAKYANKVITDNSVDLVAIGREQLADPDWARKAIKEIKSYI